MRLAVRIAKVTETSHWVGGALITPESRVVELELPWARAVWRCPSAIRVERNGATTRTVIVDVTRSLEVAAVASALAAVLLRWRTR
jgi:hypothetical protein